MSKKENSFYGRLSEKLEKQTDSSFDRGFWKKFDDEFSVETDHSWFSHLKSMFFGNGALYPASALAGIALVVFMYGWMPRESSKNVDLLAALEWSEGTEIAQDLELFEEMDADDWMLSATDEDWEVLLDGNAT